MKEVISGQKKLRLAKILLGGTWLFLIILCLLHPDFFTPDRILTYTPQQPLFAAFVLLGLFALKSLSIFLYSGFLYVVTGILFPLPIAIFLNILGTAIMVSIPYHLGKKLGNRVLPYILKRWPKAALLSDLRSRSDFFFVLIVRLLGVLSADVVSLYMGAVQIPYRIYLPACLLGFLSPCILFPIMGTSISNIRSPQFLIAACLQLMEMLISCVVFRFFVKHKKSSMPIRNR